MLNWLRNLFRSNPWEKTGEFTHPKYRLRGYFAAASEESPCVTAASGRSLVVSGPHFSQQHWCEVWYAEPERGFEQVTFRTEAEARAYVAKYPTLPPLAQGLWSVHETKGARNGS